MDPQATVTLLLVAVCVALEDRVVDDLGDEDEELPLPKLVLPLR